MLVRITGYSKLAVNVNVNTNCCMLVYSSPAMDLQTVQDVYHPLLHDKWKHHCNPELDKKKTMAV